MAGQEGTGEIAKRSDTPPAVEGKDKRTLQLGPQLDLDLSNLSPREADALEAKAHEKAIERDDRRQRLTDDLRATAAQLEVFTRTVDASTDQNASVTITNTKNDSLGRTEMILGTSDAARSGKLSRSQQGFSDNPIFWIVLAAIAGAVIVLVAALKR